MYFKYDGLNDDINNLMDNITDYVHTHSDVYDSCENSVTCFNTKINNYEMIKNALNNLIRKQNEDKQNEDKPNEDKPNEDKQNEDKQNEDKQNEDKQNEDKQNNDVINHTLDNLAITQRDNTIENLLDNPALPHDLKNLLDNPVIPHDLKNLLDNPNNAFGLRS
jgi:hypothetical protein